MKVAVCFSGQARFLDGRQIAVLKRQLLEKYDCDVYYHFWWKEGGEYITSNIGNQKNEKDMDKKIRRIFNPKVMKYDDPLPANYFSLPSGKWTYNTASMYTSIKKSFDLIPKDLLYTYDFVIRCRTDIWLDFFPNLHVLDKSKIHFPPNSGRKDYLINHCWICPPKFCKAFNLIQYYLNDHKYALSSDELILPLVFQEMGIREHVVCHPWWNFRADRINRGNYDQLSIWEWQLVYIVCIIITCIFIQKSRSTWNFACTSSPTPALL